MNDLGGVLPNTDRLVIYLGCDVPYAIEHAVPLIYSLDAHSPGHHVHVHVYNLTRQGETVLRCVANDLKDTRVTVSWEITDLSELTALQRKTYYASVRFVRLYQIMLACPGAYLALDADSIVRGRLTPPNADIGLFLRPDYPPQMQIAAGAVFVGGWHGAVFLRHAADLIAGAVNTGHLDWYVDQLALVEAYRQARDDGATIHRFDQRFMSWDWDPLAPIWTGKGPRKYEADEYRGVVAAHRADPDALRERLWA